MHKEPLIETHQLSRTFVTGEVEVRALRDVSLTIESGEFVCLSGWSGSGKTTLLNLIGTLDLPTSGRVTIAGVDPQTMTDHQRTTFRLNRIGFVFQAYNLIPVLTGFENAEMLLELQGVPKTQRRKQVTAILDVLGVLDIANKRPPEMSGGQQQRFAVARAIAAEPDIVLADEPTANLDSKTSRDLMDLMSHLNEDKQITFVFSSHDSLIHERAKRLIELRDGQVIRDTLAAT